MNDRVTAQGEATGLCDSLALQQKLTAAFKGTRLVLCAFKRTKNPFQAVVSLTTFFEEQCRARLPPAVAREWIKMDRQHAPQLRQASCITRQNVPR